MSDLQNICVYCASSALVEQKYKDLARDLGVFLARDGRRVVYGGGHVGLMGILADAALAAGGEVIGVIPTFLKEKEVAHDALTRLYTTPDMQTRQSKMAELSDAFVILPGGLGTLAEFFEIVTWKYLSLHDKPIVFIDPDGYWSSLLTMLDQSYDAKFLRQKPQDLFDVYASIEDFKVILA